MNEQVKVVRLNSEIYDLAVMSILFIIPAGSLKLSIEDFIHVSMDNYLPDQEIIVDETGIDEVSAETFTRLRIDPRRLRNANDDYDSILFYPEREIVVRD